MFWQDYWFIGACLASYSIGRMQEEDYGLLVELAVFVIILLFWPVFVISKITHACYIHFKRNK